MWTCTHNPQIRINTFYPQAAARNTAAEMFRIIWLSISGEYAQILIHLSLGQQLSDQLRRRGYNIRSIATATSKVRPQRRDDLLRYKPKPEPSATLIPFVLTYHPELPRLSTNTGQLSSLQNA